MLPGDGLGGFVVETQVNAFVLKELLILLKNGIARLGEDLDQRSFVQFVEDADDRQAADKLRDEPELNQILRLGLAQQFGVAL